MNKFLMGSSALVTAAMFAAPAFAAEKIQIQVRGYHVGGIAITDADCERDGGLTCNGSSGFTNPDDSNEINFGSDSEVHFRGSTTLDNGLEVSFRAELELEDDSDVDGDADQIDEVYIQFDGGFGRIQFGQNDGAMDQMAVVAPLIFREHGHSDPDMDPFSPYGPGNPIDTVGDLSGDDIKLSYFTPSFNGLQFGVSWTPNPCKNDTGYSGCVGTEMGRNYLEISGTFDADLGNVDLGFSAGYGAGDSGGASDGPTEWTVGMDIGFGGFTIGGSYKDSEPGGDPTAEITDWDLGIAYEAGPWAFNVAYGEQENKVRPWRTDESESWIVGATYMYGPGMQIGLGLQTLDREHGDNGGQDYEGFDGTSIFIENAISF